MPTKVIRFGLFELNTATRQLHKQGRRIRLQEQPMRILEILLEEPGELVSRQELKQRLWASDIHVDFELGLNGAIKRLRLALGDSADNPRFIETVPKSGYRFIAPVQAVTVSQEMAGQPAPSSSREPAVSDSSLPPATQTASEPLSPALTSRSARTGSLRFAIAVSLAVVAVLLGYLLRPLSPSLQVTRIVKLSNSGNAWPRESLLSDGARVYYTEFTVGGGFQLRQILLNGNEDRVVGGIPPNSLIRGLSPDSTTFLGISRAAAENDRPAAAWLVPVVGGPARLLGNVLTNDATWSPHGHWLAFTRDSQIFIANPDGTKERALATLPGRPFYLRWSPGGGRLRFSVLDSNGQLAIWEIRADGRNLHPLQFNWPGSPMEGFGEWTRDGRYFVFTSRREGISNLWAVEEKTGWLYRRRSEPMQLTAGPMNYYRPLPSRDGSRIFALGMQPAGELLRYDLARKEFVRFLGGRSADHLDFTRDGRWVAYVAYPEATLWRGKSDGSQQLQLTFPPLRVSVPQWSPDGKRILFVGQQPGELPKIYSLSLDGGTPEPLLPEPHAQAFASWSPAGDFIVYGRDPDGENQDIFLYRFDVRSGRSERIPRTEGLYRPIWSPDGRSLAVHSIKGDRMLVLFDLKTGKRTVLSKRKADYPAWSADSQYLYFNTIMSGSPAIFRVHVADGKEEKVTDVHFPGTGVYGVWSGLAPDGSPLTLRDREQTDVYALSLALR